MNKKILLFCLLLVIPFVFALKGEIEGDFVVDNVIMDDSDAQIKFYGDSGMKWAVGTSGGASDNFIIYDYGSSATRLTINDSNGDVGIGTSTPKQKLHVIGDLNVSGDIHHGGFLIPESPIFLGKDSDVSYTRFCVYDEEGYLNLMWFKGGVMQIETNSDVCKNKEAKINVRRNCEEQGKVWDYDKGKCISE